MLQPRPHQKRVHQIAQKAERQLVVHNVDHLHPAWYFFEKMLVVPDAVRPHPLLVDKELSFLYMGNFRHPGDRNPEYWTNFVLDEHARVHLVRQLGLHLEPHIGRRDDGEVARRGKEFPGGLHIDRQSLYSLELIHFYSFEKLKQ